MNIPETQLQDYVLEVVQHTISNKVPQSSLMYKSLKTRVYHDVVNDITTMMVRWLSLEYKHEPLVFERDASVGIPKGWFQHLKYEYPWLQRIFGRAIMTQCNYKMTVTVYPSSLFIDPPYVKEFENCKYIRRTWSEPVIKVERL